MRDETEKIGLSGLHFSLHHLPDLLPGLDLTRLAGLPGPVGLAGFVEIVGFVGSVGFVGAEQVSTISTRSWQDIPPNTLPSQSY